MKHSTRFTALLVALIAIPLIALGAGGKASTASNGILRNTFMSTSQWTAGSTYVGLFSVCPVAATTSSNGTLGTETTGTSYARVGPITKADANWSYNAAACTANGAPLPCCTAASTGANCGTSTYGSLIGNASAITFAVAGSSWGTAACFGVWDAATAGNLLYWGPVAGTPTIGSGSQASFAINALSITEQ